ncbi:septum site-determining protein MinC [Prochlorococcus sp. MIT 0801]|uniref:septum site-determining protein MinC n=1 Tax=Prochlorococcus sp. MIT 0801 TaxID=1501269 RepID=UPI0004F63A35|nr:septum site-determining protein MinC [Prochlorococcus sp. MIT 0801]AIQ96521.1 Septum site-determining protein MinC [Prochlorococcus sp. MIT 0801]
MNLNNQKIIINIDDRNYPNWKIDLKNKLKNLKSNNLEIDSRNIDLSCKDISEIIAIANQYDCKIISFCSSSPKTIVSSQSLGYKSQFIFENSSKNISEINKKNLTFLKTHFHQGTVRSGEYLESPGDLLILGDVNPGAKVSAEGNIIIWGRLLGIAHAGSKGNSKARISALQLRPVQLRIAKKVARGPKEKPHFGLAEQARIDSEEIIISPLETT